MFNIKTAWAHLPNAAHIDNIFEDVALRPEVWRAAEGAAWMAARGEAWEAARRAAINEVWKAARDARWSTAGAAAVGAVLALVAWDDAALMLGYHELELRALADSGNHAAVLMLPAVIAYATATQPELKASDIAMPSLDGSALPSLDEIDLFDTLSFGRGVPMDKELLEMVLTTPLMTWNHRVVDMSHTNGGDPWFEVREVSYNRQGEATGHASVCLGTEDPASIIALLQRMIDDIRLSPTPIKFDNQETSND